MQHVRNISSIPWEYLAGTPDNIFIKIRNNLMHLQGFNHSLPFSTGTLLRHWKINIMDFLALISCKSAVLQFLFWFYRPLLNLDKLNWGFLEKVNLGTNQVNKH